MRHLQGAVLSDDTLQALLTQFDLNRNGSFDIVSAAASLLERKFRRSSQTSDGEEVWDVRSCGSEFSAGNGLDGGGYAGAHCPAARAPCRIKITFISTLRPAARRHHARRPSTSA